MNSSVPSNLWEKCIISAQSLVTPTTVTRQGFIDQALERSRQATPFVQQARAFRNALGNTKDIDDLLLLTDYYEELIAVAGYSDKAWRHVSRGLSQSEEKGLLRDFFIQLYEECKLNARGEEKDVLALFQEEIVYRYLLTKGDTIGGQMRNWVGRLHT